MKKIISILLALLMLGSAVFVFASCDPDEPTIEKFELTKEKLSSYSVIMPEIASKDLQLTVNNFLNDIKAVTGKTPEMNDDFLADGSTAGEYEILVGKVNRAETPAFYKNIKVSDHGYALVGKKILILGYTDKMIASSISDFKKDVLTNAGDGVLLRDGDNKIVSPATPYDFDTIMLNGVSINEYKIVYPSKSTAEENLYASRLNNWITEKTGYVLDVVVDTKSERSDYEINLGTTNRVEDKNTAIDAGIYSLSADAGLIWLYGKTTTLMRCAVSELCNSLTASGTIDVSTQTKMPTKLSLSVMSYNIYFDLEDADRDPQGVLTSIEERMPDVFDTLEANEGWFKLFNEKFGDLYTVVKGKKFENVSDGLYNAIFFKKGMFTVIESGTRWFSDTPTKVSKFDISPHYKGMTYAVLKEKSTGATFVYVAVHTSAGETRSEAKYVENANLCREKQIEVLKEQLERFSLYPIIIGGDFNAKPTSKSISLLTTKTRYADATKVAEEVIYTLPDNETHPTLCRVKKLGVDDNTVPPYTELNPSAQQIDYFFVTKDSITVQKFEEWDNKVNGKYPSDHIPVWAELTIFAN